MKTRWSFTFTQCFVTFRRGGIFKKFAWMAAESTTREKSCRDDRTPSVYKFNEAPSKFAKRRFAITEDSDTYRYVSWTQIHRVSRVFSFSSSSSRSSFHFALLLFFFLESSRALTFTPAVDRLLTRSPFPFSRSVQCSRRVRTIPMDPRKVSVKRSVLECVIFWDK